MKSYFPVIPSRASFNLFSRPTLSTSSISAPERSTWDGIRSSPSHLVGMITSAALIDLLSIMRSYTVSVFSSTSTPSPFVALNCGSMSTTRTVFSSLHNAAARFNTVTVLPTPPFSFATAMILVRRSLIINTSLGLHLSLVVGYSGFAPVFICKFILDGVDSGEKSSPWAF